MLLILQYDAQWQICTQRLTAIENHSHPLYLSKCWWKIIHKLAIIASLLIARDYKWRPAQKYTNNFLSLRLPVFAKADEKLARVPGPEQTKGVIPQSFPHKVKSFSNRFSFETIYYQSKAVRRKADIIAFFALKNDCDVVSLTLALNLLIQFLKF